MESFKTQQPSDNTQDRELREATDSPVRARNLNEETNAALMDMMGVIKEPGEVARGTLTRLTKLVARASADKRMAEMLEGMGLATRRADFKKGTAIELDLRGGKRDCLYLVILL